MPKQKTTVEDAISNKTLRIAMIERGWDYYDLCKAIGVQRKSIRAFAGLFIPHHITRMKIERAFDYKKPIWSTPVMLTLRDRCQRDFGFDFELVTSTELKTQLEQYNVPCIKEASLPMRLDAWVKFLAANPNFKPKREESKKP